MKRITLILLSATVIILAACSGGQKQSVQADSNAKQEAAKPVEINNEAKLLLDYLAKNGDYVNSREFPSLISAEPAFEVLEAKTLVIDMRKPDVYKKGHIKGAVNVEMPDLPVYFSEKIKPFEYDNIILACYSGQSSSYAASLLRLMGYGNVFSLRLGMSGWNPKMDNKWAAGISSRYESKLDTITYSKAAAGDLPLLNTGKTNGAEIFDARVVPLFSVYENAHISADSVFARPEKYYIINYERKDKYDTGHIPGAVRYKPGGTLGIIAEMQTIPADKEVVVYCGTGHNSAFVTAYLRLFGYNAKTLRFGNNSFMHNKMVREEQTMSWQPYQKTDTKNFPVVK
ncbi:MAG: rhodanese-like domain-containing protein [Draconibacterium sp.]